jgi:hypothetical protein
MKHYNYIVPREPLNWKWRDLPPDELTVWKSIESRWVYWAGSVLVDTNGEVDKPLPLWHKLCYIDYDSLQLQTKLPLQIVKRCVNDLLRKGLICPLFDGGCRLYPHCLETSWITPCILFVNSREGRLWQIKVEGFLRYRDTSQEVPEQLLRHLGIRENKPIEAFPPSSTTGYVYLVKREGKNEYKIGKSIQPTTRIHKLGVDLPFPITVTHLIKCDDHHRMERDLHDRFARKRLAGEWFRLDAEDIEYIKSLSLTSDGA